MKTKKYLTVIVMLIVTLVVSYSIPRAKYRGTGFISTLNISDTVSGWSGRDVTKEVGLNVNSSLYDFVSEAVAYQYTASLGQSLLFIVLDAGNFHHPKACFTGAGFKIKDLDDTEFQLPDRTFRAHTLYTERGKDSFLSFYWIVIDKNIAHDWIEQKFKQLYFSMFGKKRVGLMVRVDIPAKESDAEYATNMARKFIDDLQLTIQPEHADYIFGEKTL